MRDDRPLSAETIAELYQLAATRAAAGDAFAEQVLCLLRDRGHLRVTARALLAALPPELADLAAPLQALVGVPVCPYSPSTPGACQP
jgi:hypothetical protein